MSEMKVGRDLDAAVAKALGYPLSQDRLQCLIEGCWYAFERRSGFMTWRPSMRIADAFAALEAVLAKHEDMTVIMDNASGGWSCSLVSDHTVTGHGYTPAEAISRCIIALEATDGH